MALALLPSDKVEEGFNAIIDEIISQGLYDEWKQFIIYFGVFWMLQTGPHIFSVYKIPHRINNNAESYHSAIQKQFGSNPSVKNFIGNKY